MASNKAYKEAVETELTRHGVTQFYWDKRGKHEACYYTLPDKRHRFTIVPCTPGDHRGVLNKRSDVRKELRELGLVPLDKKAKLVKVAPETCKAGGIVARAPHLDEMDGDYT